MNDFSKCPGHGCQIAKFCKRYLTPAGEVQSWADFRYDPETGCEYFVEVNDNGLSNCAE